MVQGSLFNHTCINANARFQWNDDEKVGIWTSIRDITKDEEITIDYLGQTYPTYLRRKHLQVMHYVILSNHQASFIRQALVLKTFER